MRLVINLESQPISKKRTLQNGRVAPTKHHSQIGRLVHQGGPQRCILSCSNPPKPLEILELPMGRETAPVCLSPIWTSLSPEDVHEGDETGPGMSSITGYTMYNIPRPTDHGRSLTGRSQF